MAGREREVTNEEILTEMFLGDDPAYVASELADALNMSRQGMHSRLEELEEDGDVHSKKPGRDRIYWLTNDARARIRSSLRG